MELIKQRQATQKEREGYYAGVLRSPFVLWDMNLWSEGYAHEMFDETSEKRFDLFFEACADAMISYPPRNQCHHETLYVSDQICNTAKETPHFLEGMKLKIKCPSCGNAPNKLVIIETSGGDQ